MTIQEVLDCVEAYNNKSKSEMQFKALCAYSQASLVVTGVKALFSKEVKYPQLHEAFPALFEKPKEEEFKQQDYRVTQARMMAYNEAWKKRNKKG